MGLVQYKPYTDDEIQEAIADALSAHDMTAVESLLVEMASRDMPRATRLMDVMKGAIAARELGLK